MGKIILAREQDQGKKDGGILALLMNSLTTGVIGGIVVSAILCPLIQRLLNNRSTLFAYCFNVGSVFFLMAVCCFVMRSDFCGSNYIKCKMCRRKMRPLTGSDTLFQLPVKGEEKYDDALHYLAANMKKISGMNELEEEQRCCYVCVYQCDKCFKRMIRIKDFLPDWGVCVDKGTYYFDYTEFMYAGGQIDERGTN